MDGMVVQPFPMHPAIERRRETFSMAEFSLVKWLKCLECHMVMEKGTHIDANLSAIAIVYSAVVVVMMEVVYRQV